MTFNYKKICDGLLNDLAPRTKEVIKRRFCLMPAVSNLAQRAEQRETLESIEGKISDKYFDISSNGATEKKNFSKGFSYKCWLNPGNNTHKTCKILTAPIPPNINNKPFLKLTERKGDVK